MAKQSKSAPEFVKLTDGEKLLSMLEQLELGLKPRRTYEVDSAFFDQFGQPLATS
jgi:hypothetical protein